MTINNTTRRADLTGNGTLKAFDFSFKIFETDDVEVFLDGTLQASSAYTVTIATDSDGGTITFTTAPGADVAVAIVGSLDASRSIDYQENGAFAASAVNDDFDKLYAIAQESIDVRERSIALTFADTDATLTLPLKDERSSKFLAFDSDGNVVATRTVGTWKDAWASSTIYSIGDVVTRGGTGTDQYNIYISAEDHTSGSDFATDLAADKWVLVLDVETALVDLTNTTAFILTLLDDTDAATARATLGAGTGDGDASLDTAQEWTAGQYGGITTLTDAASIAIDLSASNNFKVTLGGDRTLANPTNASPGQSGVIEIWQDATGSRTLSYGDKYVGLSGLSPNLNTEASHMNLLFYYVRSDSKVLLTSAVDVKGFSS